MNVLIILMISILAILLNSVIGSIVWASIDRDGRLLEWVRQCPNEVLKWIVISAWPAALWLKFKHRAEMH